MIVPLTGMFLPVGQKSGLPVPRNQGCIESRVVVPGLSRSNRSDRMCHPGIVGYRITCNDIDGSAYGRRPVQSRSPTPDHFYAIYHVGRDLFQSVYAGQRGKYRPRVYQDLGIMAVKPVYPHLVKAAILAIVLYPYPGLKRQGICQAYCIGLFNDSGSHHTHKGRAVSPDHFCPAGGNDYLVQRNHIGNQLNILHGHFTLF